MSDGPLTLVRRRFARSIDWRVDTAVAQAVAPLQAEVRSTAHADTSRRVDLLEAQIERLDAAIERLRKSVTSLSVTLTDAQRAQGELLDRLAADVNGRPASVGLDPSQSPKR